MKRDENPLADEYGGLLLAFAALHSWGGKVLKISFGVYPETIREITFINKE